MFVLREAGGTNGGGELTVSVSSKSSLYGTDSWTGGVHGSLAAPWVAVYESGEAGCASDSVCGELLLLHLLCIWCHFFLTLLVTYKFGFWIQIGCNAELHGCKQQL